MIAWEWRKWMSWKLKNGMNEQNLIPLECSRWGSRKSEVWFLISWSGKPDGNQMDSGNQLLLLKKKMYEEDQFFLGKYVDANETSR